MSDRYTKYDVEASIGMLHATVEAADPEAAITAAIEQWTLEADEIFSAAMFYEPWKVDE